MVNKETIKRVLELAAWMVAAALVNELGEYLTANFDSDIGTALVTLAALLRKYRK